jgi:transposase
VDNHGFVLGPLTLHPVNMPDTRLLPESLTNLVALTRRMGLDLRGSALTLDSGFDSQANRDTLKTHHLTPVIYPNRRSTKKPITIAQKFRWFDRAVYRERDKVARTWGWQDTYRKLVVSFDRLPAIRKGCRLVAYAMINFRVTFSSS